MRFYIIRHARVRFTWKKTYNSAEFDRACDGYDSSPIETVRKKTDRKNETVHISALNRTFDTAKGLFGSAEFEKSSLFNEVPLKSFRDTEREYPSRVWKVIGRMQWLMNNRRQIEIRKETEQRAREAIRMLEARGEDCYIVSHEVFMRILVRELRKKGYRITKSQRIVISNLAMIVAEKGL